MITVLLADDHIMVRDGLRYILEAAGDMEIIGLASNGKEAVAQAGRGCPDIAVIDISRPVMDGIEATKQILAMCPDTQYRHSFYVPHRGICTACRRCGRVRLCAQRRSRHGARRGGPQPACREALF